MLANHENGRNYDVLAEAAKSIKGIEGLTLEVGLRDGGGTRLIIDSLLENGDNNRTHVSIDPYGDIPYNVSDIRLEFRGCGYNNSLMKSTLAELYDYVKNKPIHVLFLPVEDTIFFDKFRDGIPVYQSGKLDVINTYALVYFDGPHTTKQVLEETKFFEARAKRGAFFVYDDVTDHYDHAQIEKYLLDRGWKLKKASYKKNSYVKAG